ncbi:hypothetical protein [Neoroseomonas lacus]|nr:hypothetical protein [Neoroseomonas lacus]
MSDRSTTAKPVALDETQQLRTAEKVDRPATHFDGPHDVATDSELSEGQKREALDTLEQDARQLSDAAAEGMSGGERSNLDDVLDAKAGLAGTRKDAAQLAEGWTDRLAPLIRKHPASSLAAAAIAGICLGMSIRR